MTTAAIRTALLLAIYSGAIGVVAPDAVSAQGRSASRNEMSLYTRIGALNTCIFLAAGIDYDRATKIAGETIAQTIKEQNDGKISDVANGSILTENELRKGAVNSAILGSVEVCPNAVPVAIRERVKSVLASREAGALPPTIDSNRTSEPLERKMQDTGPSLEPIMRPDQFDSPAKLAVSITVQIETSGPSGSGTIISKDGNRYTIATACHVVANTSKQEDILIITGDGNKHSTKGLSTKRYGSTDMCSLAFSSSNSYTVPLLSFENMGIGDALYVSGWSLANNDVPSALRFTEGIVTGSTKTASADGYSLIYTTKAPTLPGMSGGPIIRNRKLVGIHGRSERAPETISDGKVLATTYSLGMPLSILNVKR